MMGVNDTMLDLTPLRSELFLHDKGPYPCGGRDAAKAERITRDFGALVNAASLEHQQRLQQRQHARKKTIE